MALSPAGPPIPRKLFPPPIPSSFPLLFLPSIFPLSVGWIWSEPPRRYAVDEHGSEPPRRDVVDEHVVTICFRLDPPHGGMVPLESPNVLPAIKFYVMVHESFYYLV